jgi:hypothetical protein
MSVGALPMNQQPVAQVSQPAGAKPRFGSPISKSAGRRGTGRVAPADGTRVWKPAIRQTWKSALPHCLPRLAALVLSAVLLPEFSARAESTNDVAGDSAALALASRIYWAVPGTNFTEAGVLKIRDPDRQTTAVPLRIETVVTATNWQTVYTIGTNPGLAAGFTITHAAGMPNQYFRNVARPPGSPPSLADSAWAVPLAPGSDFSLGDLGLEFLRWPAQRILKKEFHRQCACLVLESTNPRPAPGSYARVVAWIDEESLGIVEAYAYDAGGRELKNFYPKNFEKVNGRYQLESMVMNNSQTESRSVFEFDPH